MDLRRNNPSGSSEVRMFPLPLRILGAPREFHVSRRAREAYGISSELGAVRGTLLFTDLGAIRQLAARVNALRVREGRQQLSVATVHAAAVLDEVLHLVIQLHRDGRDSGFFSSALAALRAEMGAAATDSVLLEFVQQFPTPAQLAEGIDAAAYLDGSRDSVPNREVVLEELLLLWLANRNPALQELKVFFDDSQLRQGSRYPELIRGLQEALAADTAEPGPDLVGVLLAPQLASPGSLAGQLQFLRAEYSAALGGAFAELLDQLLLAGDLIREETGRFVPGPGNAEVPTVQQLAGNAGGGSADEGTGARGSSGAGAGYSSDADWMPELVLTARNCLVWLGQLGRKYGSRITRLDEVPEAELQELAAQGFTGLWLIGIWERSRASQRIKELRGQPDAVASAYSITDYRVAAQLGGGEALARLRERAWKHGVRLASDMVPNHTGMDSTWVAEHPDRFIQLPEPPYGGYTFNGPDLSGDPRFQVYLEDHYYDGSDAAVVFKRTAPGEADRFIYHGNDGTALPWNDTAQLDYLQEEVREAVIGIILEVARHFPIIRFDAAMTLARQHVQRLWYPAPGEGGAIPSRAEHGSMAADTFLQLMPREFWREVVDRVALEAPDTLLLAEAFWMMEGYFVRTLGMHRVYNSAFMNMLARQANGDYRAFLKNILELDPAILQRLVNFLSNPDEESAAVQFGTGDRYFAAAVLLGTLPGLPLFAHGQVAGLSEKYGMEFQTARLEESPDADLIARHGREVFPLLLRRAEFASAAAFELYDLQRGDGSTDEDVIAFSNRSDGGQASLVIVNNQPAATSGRLYESTPRRREGAEAPGGLPLLQALGFGGEDAGEGALLTCREQLTGELWQLPVSELAETGLNLRLAAYARIVLLDFRLQSGNEPEDDGEPAGTESGGVGSVRSGPTVRPPRESAGSSDASGPVQVRRPHDD